MVASKSLVWFSAKVACYGLMLIIAVVASVTDVRRRRIPNKLVATGLGLAISLHAVIVGSSAGFLRWGDVIGQEASPSRLVTSIAVNAAFGAIVSVSLYLFGLWSAGDAKLAIFLALAQPAWVTLRSPVPCSPFIVLLGNTLLVMVTLVVVEVIVRGGPLALRALRGALAEGKAPWTPGAIIEGGRIALALVALATALGPARSWLGGRAEEVVSGGALFLLLLLYVAYRPIGRVVRLRVGLAVAAVIFVASATYLLWAQGAAGMRSIASSIGVGLLVMVSRWIFRSASRTFDRVRLEVNELEPGLVLAEETLARLAGDRRWTEAFEPVVGDLRSTGLDANLIKNLREWHEHNAKGEQFVVEAHLPFAPALALGVVLTATLGRIAVVW